VLEDLGKFTGHFWSDTLALEPFICETFRHRLPCLAGQKKGRGKGSEASAAR